MSDEKILAYYPFAGDQDMDVSVLSDKMVVGRKPYECELCRGPIAQGDRHRALTERNNEDPQIRTFRFCPACCEAMALSWDDSGEAMEKRFVLQYEVPTGAAPKEGE